VECGGREKRRRRFSPAPAFMPGSRVGHPVFDSPIYGGRGLSEAEVENLLKEVN